MVADRVREIVVARFLQGDSTYPLDASMDLLQAGICDSLGLMELASELESAFPGVGRIDDQDIGADNLGSVDRIVAYLASKGVTA